MNKLSIAALIAGTAVVTGFIVSKVIANKKKTAPTDDIWDDDFDAQCCDGCCCDEDIDVVIAGENTGDCAEAVSGAADEAYSPIILYKTTNFEKSLDILRFQSYNNKAV